MAKVVEKSADNQLIDEFSFVDCKTDGVILETVKKSDLGDGIILRAYEAYKQRKTVEIYVGENAQASLCDLNENEIEKLSVVNGLVKFKIKPFEIVTIKIKRV